MAALLKTFLDDHQYFDLSFDDFALHLKTNPDYPSLKAISDTLDYFKIENGVFDVPKEELDNLPRKFLAVVNYESGDSLFAVVTKHRSHIKVRNEKDTLEKLSTEEFKKIWSGTILIIDDNDRSGILAPFNKNTPWLALGALAIIGCNILANASNIDSSQWPLDHPVSIINSQWSTIYLILSVLGAVVAYMIAQQSFGVENTTTEKMCGFIGQPTNCKDLITHKKVPMVKTIG